MSVETTLCRLMGYKYAALFPRARDALKIWAGITNKKIKIPTNCCSALLPFASELVPVDPETGLAPIPVQLYGYRNEFSGAEIEIDPLMTGALGRPFAESTIVSFGYGKTIDLGGGGAILTQDHYIAEKLGYFTYFPELLRRPLAAALYNFHSIIMEKKKQYEETENEWYGAVDRLPTRPVIPWRFVAKNNKHTQVCVDNQRGAFKIGTNYPPLPGVTDPGAIEWGQKVINIWK